MVHLPILKMFWNDTDDLAACGQGRIGYRAHQAYMAAAVNQLQAAPRDFLT